MQITLFSDAQTKLLTKGETLSDHSVLGDTTDEVVYDDWRPVGKLTLPFRYVDKVGVVALQDLRASSITVDTTLDESLFAVPAGLANIERTLPARKVTKLGEDVYLAPGAYNIVSAVSRNAPIAWDRGVFFELIYWLVWGLYTPLIFRLAWRYHLQNPQRTRSVLALLGGGLLIAPLQVATEAAISLAIAWRVLHHPTAEILQRIALMPRIILIESFTGLVTYAVIAGVFYAFDYYRKFRERELQAAQLAGRLAQAELHNLKMRLHPHFLFNTLHAISVLMQEDVTAANRMLVQLSELLRMTLENAGTQETTLRQELEFLQRYLEIEQGRFHDRLTVKTEIDPAALDARVPSLILQPLVENALRHGIARRASAGVIEIRAHREGEQVLLEVRDNGPGLQADAPAAGVGLNNTRARLEQLSWGGAPVRDWQRR